MGLILPLYEWILVLAATLFAHESARLGDHGSA
jgi:hypothetical protein